MAKKFSVPSIRVLSAREAKGFTVAGRRPAQPLDRGLENFAPRIALAVALPIHINPVVES